MKLRELWAILPLLACALDATGAPLSMADRRKGHAVFVLAMGYPHAPGLKSLKMVGFDARTFARTVAASVDADNRNIQRYQVLTLDHLPAYDSYLLQRRFTWQAFEDSVNYLAKQINLYNAEEWETTLFVYYAGHGNRDSHQVGRVYFPPKKGPAKEHVGAPFTANDFLEKIFDKIKATRIHFVADSCNAYYLLAPKGPESYGIRSRRRQQDEFGEIYGNLAPHVGFILATSGEARAYESPQYGGIATMLVRSALMGYSDVDLDGRVSYEEMAAFLSVATSAVPKTKVPELYVQPPRRDAEWDASWSGATLVNLAVGATSVLKLEPGEQKSIHTYVEDATGRRLFESHLDTEDQGEIWLQNGAFEAARPLTAFIYEDGKSVPFRKLEPGAVTWTSMTPIIDQESSTELKPRGPARVVARNLFSHPFGQQDVVKYREARLRGTIFASKEHFISFRAMFGPSFQGLTTATHTERPMTSARLSSRLERESWVLGGELEILVPFTDRPGTSLGASFSAFSGYTLPFHSVQLEPRVGIGPVARWLDTERGTYGARAYIGTTLLAYLPWNTGVALALDAGVGPEWLANLSFYDRKDHTHALGLVGWVGLGLDWETQE